MIQRAGLGDELLILSERPSVTINPLLSGLSGKKIAEFLVRSLLAGKLVSLGSGSAYYESRALALLGNIISVALFSNRPCLRLVSEMVDMLSGGGVLDSSHLEAADALKRIEVFALGEEREKKMVLDSIQNYLDVFRDDPWRSIFFEYGPYNLDLVRDEGKLIVAAFSPNKVSNLNSGLFLLKMLFYATVMDRLTTGFLGNSKRLCVFMIDEFASVATGNSDGEFLAMRREAGACPIFAFQQITQLETVVPGEWRNILGLLTTKIFLRASDMDTAMWGERICGFVNEEAHSVTRTPDSMNLIYDETSRTTTRQLRPRVPADYFLAMPDGDAVIVNDKRALAWFPAFGMASQDEITWRQNRWPERPQLLPPSEFRQ
ncbi:MAG: TraM recognition domain-containing protein [Methylacidiphilales bacterium]|nr:TraM recognition domain-containing protein [Candidatus Methylacidiphilales bacterium]